MAADWLKTALEYRLMEGECIPDMTLGHDPVRGGRVLLVAVEASLDTVKSVTATQGSIHPKVEQKGSPRSDRKDGNWRREIEGERTCTDTAKGHSALMPWNKSACGY